MEKGKMIYEGKAKRVYETNDPDLYIQEFKDDATAFDDALLDSYHVAVPVEGAHSRLTASDLS